MKRSSPGFNPRAVGAVLAFGLAGSIVASIAVAAGADQLEEVVVTGSLIRGAGDGPSPVVTVTRDQMDRDGRATVAQLLASLPQNFGGTANEGALNNGADRSGTLSLIHI